MIALDISVNRYLSPVFIPCHNKESRKLTTALASAASLTETHSHMLSSVKLYKKLPFRSSLKNLLPQLS